MKNKIFLIMLAFLLIIPSVLSLTVTPQEVDVELFSTSSENIFFNITNNEDVNLYDIEFLTDSEDVTFVDNKIDLNPGETVSVKAVVDTDSNYEATETIKVIHYKQEDIFLQPEDMDVEINNYKYEPSNLEIVKGSKITWWNNDVLKHSVTSSLFDHDIEAGSSYEYVFNEAGIFDYYDKHTNYQGRIYVKDVLENGLVHDPKETIYAKINIKSILVETELNLSFIDGSDFTVEYNSKKESVISIINNGDKVALGVALSSDPAWVTFGKTNFNLDSSQTTYVPFTIKPLISNSNNTDQTHIIDIIIKGDNFQTKTFSLNVFVPYREDVSLNETVDNYFDGSMDLNLMNAIHVLFCQANPEHQYCVPKIIEKLIETTPQIYVNLSAEDVYTNNRKTAENREYVERAIKTISEDIDGIKNDTSTAKESAVEANINTKELYAQTLENEEDLNQLQGLMITLSIFAVFLGLGFLGYKFFLKKYMKDREFSS